MLVRLDKRESDEKGSGNAETTAKHASPVEVDGMLERLEGRGLLTQTKINLDQA